LIVETAADGNEKRAFFLLARRRDIHAVGIAEEQPYSSYLRQRVRHGCYLYYSTAECAGHS